MEHLPACIEALEDRRLCSVYFTHHVLVVRGAVQFPNTVVVGLSPDGQSVSASMSFPFHHKTHSYHLEIPLSRGISVIRITGGNASDSITIDQTNGTFPVRTSMTLHNGNDVVHAGDEADSIICGNGNDWVASGNGNDTLIGGRSPDVLVAGDGNDFIRTGQQADLIIAGNGNDTFFDTSNGGNTITAGSGHDKYVVRHLHNDTTTYDATKDTLRVYNRTSDGNNNAWVNDVVNAVVGYLL